MLKKLGAFIDWIQRGVMAYGWWVTLAAAFPIGAWALVPANYLLPHEILFFVSFIAAGSASAVYYAHRYLHPDVAQVAAASPAFKRIDVALWINHDSYMVWQAACLWVEIEPVDIIPLDSPAYPISQRLSAALRENWMESKYGGTGMNAIVSLDDLRTHAHTVKEFPKFLFPNGPPKNRTQSPNQS